MSQRPLPGDIRFTEYDAGAPEGDTTAIRVEVPERAKVIFLIPPGEQDEQDARDNLSTVTSTIETAMRRGYPAVLMMPPGWQVVVA